MFQNKDLLDPNLIGVTEAGDPVFDQAWVKWVFDDRRPAIVISKNPTKLYEIMHGKSDETGFIPNVIVHCTITGFGGTKVEPGVPRPDDAMTGYGKFVEWLGREHVVLRCDPIFPAPAAVEIAVSSVLSKNLGTRMRISFIDAYRHVIERFREIGYDYSKLGLDENSFHVEINRRRKLADMIMTDPRINGELLSACAEPGIKSEPCVSKYDCEILGVKWKAPEYKQRFACNCAWNKIELLRGFRQCGHKCVYCYWKK